MLLKNFIRLTLISAFSLASLPALAQGGPGGAIVIEPGPNGPTVNGMDVQTIQQTLQQSIQQSGIDINQVRQEMQNGTFNAGNYQQQINQITGQMSQVLGVDLSQMQNRMQNQNLDNLKQQLGADDQEWAILLPRIQKVINARNNTPATSGNNMMSRMMTTNTTGRNQSQTPYQKANADLRNMLNDPNTSNTIIAQKLKDYRAAADLALKDLHSAEKNLADVLTPRQEAILVDLGYMK